MKKLKLRILKWIVEKIIMLVIARIARTDVSQKWIYFGLHDIKEGLGKVRIGLTSALYQ